jgi:bifunctional non-homologous end joining protein LigD
MALLKLYNKKRKFDETSEPKGEIKKRKGAKALEFVVQKHHASHLHYDLRLEMEGVMKSWAVPKGPSMDPSVKRLAMAVEDHPISYNTFEGRIPAGNYGAGTVKIWDKGVYSSLHTVDRTESEKELLRGLHKGEIKFLINGKKLKGGFVLVRFPVKEGKEKGKHWLLIKEKDEYAKHYAKKGTKKNN